MSWFAEIYAKFGVLLGIYSYLVVFIVGGLIACGGWWVVGQSYMRQQAAFSRADATDRAIERLGDEIKDLRGLKQDRDKRREIRGVLARFIDEGSALREKCKTQEGKPELQPAINDWSKRVVVYLRPIDPSFASRFNASTGLTQSFSPSTQRNVTFWNFINFRIQTLTGILQELKD